MNSARPLPAAGCFLESIPPIVKKVLRALGLRPAPPPRPRIHIVSAVSSNEKLTQGDQSAAAAPLRQHFQPNGMFGSEHQTDEAECREIYE